MPALPLVRLARVVRQVVGWGPHTCMDACMRGVAFGLDAIHPSIPPSAPCSIKAVNGGRSDEERKKEGGKTRNETMMANKGAARCTNGPRARAQAQASSSVRMHIYTHTRGGGGGGKGGGGGGVGVAVGGEKKVEK